MSKYTHSKVHADKLNQALKSNLTFYFGLILSILYDYESKNVPKTHVPAARRLQLAKPGDIPGWVGSDCSWIYSVVNQSLG
jgi:hypothetical protein